MKNMITLTSNNFEQTLQDNEIIFVDFWADWCAPCKQFAKVYAEGAAKYPAIAFAKVDVAAETELADTFQIRSIPHIMVFKQGIVIYSEAGSMPLSTLSELADQATAADVSAIRNALEDNGRD